MSEVFNIHSFTAPEPPQKGGKAEAVASEQTSVAGQSKGPATPPAALTAPEDLLHDAVGLSGEAQAVAQAVQQSFVSVSLSEIRSERVAEAKLNLEQGAHRVQELIKLVAGRLTKFL
jgi:hypothetical protein